MAVVGTLNDGFILDILQDNAAQETITIAAGNVANDYSFFNSPRGYIIKSIEVQTPDTAQYNFKIDVIDDNLFSLASNGVEVDKFDTSNVRAYLLNFRKIHFEQHNYLTDNEAGDSIKSQTPWFIFKVTDNKGDVNEVRTFKKHMMYEKYDYDGNLIEWDRDRLWVELRDGRLVVGQFHVFDKILYDLRLFDRREGSAL